MLKNLLLVNTVLHPVFQVITRPACHKVQDRTVWNLGEASVRYRSSLWHHKELLSRNTFSKHFAWMGIRWIFSFTDRQDKVAIIEECNMRYLEVESCQQLEQGSEMDWQDGGHYRISLRIPWHEWNHHFTTAGIIASTLHKWTFCTLCITLSCTWQDRSAMPCFSPSRLRLASLEPDHSAI